MRRIPGNKKLNSFPFYAQLSIIVYVPSRNIFSQTNQGKLQYEFGNYFKSIRSENRKRPELLVRMYKVLKLSSVIAGEKALLRTVSRSSFSSNRFSPFDFHILTLNMSISSAVRPLSLRA